MSNLAWSPNDNGVSCKDGDPCTYGDACRDGKCVGTDYSCNDNLTCTADTCTGTGPGDTSAGGRRRVSWVLAVKPRVVILELGGNDGLRGLGLPETRAHLDAIIRQLKDAHVQVILAGMKLPPNYGEEYTTRFEAMYRDLAKLYALPFIPFLLERVGGEKTLNQADGIHPTGEGYRIVVENVLRILLPVLKDASTDSSGKKKKA